MFPEQILKVALVAIKHEEFHTLDYLLQDLSGWMDSPDKTTASACTTIADALKDRNEPVWLRTRKALLSYALRSAKYFEVSRASI